MTVHCINRSGSRVPRTYVINFLQEATKLLKDQVHPKRKQLLKKDLIVAFIDKQNMIHLNHRFRGKKKPTDVLSFPPTEPTSLGELALCPEVLRAQAKSVHLSFRDEICYMCLHGILHLLGYDHEQKQIEAKKMFHLQDEVFKKTIAQLR